MKTLVTLFVTNKPLNHEYILKTKKPRVPFCLKQISLIFKSNIFKSR